MSKFAIDCETVGIRDKSLLARVSIVNQYSQVVLDKYVKPTAVVTDYRSFVSGIKKRDLENGYSFQSVRNEVTAILDGSMLIGHMLRYDLNALNLSQPKRNLRDLAKYEPLVSIIFIFNLDS